MPDTADFSAPQSTDEKDVVLNDPRPFGVFVAERLHPVGPEAATWPSACKIKGVYAPDDY